MHIYSIFEIKETCIYVSATAISCECIMPQNIDFSICKCYTYCERRYFRAAKFSHIKPLCDIFV